MKTFDTRAYSINDFLEWDRNDQLVLNPRFQRRSVWTEKARSYLMDTIVRGLPIPKVFIRQTLHEMSRKTVREVVDGQQRLRTILSYMNDGFVINTAHNKEYGGLYFSQLDEVSPDVQKRILEYDLSVDLLQNVTDEEVLDIFGRLNAYAVTLNVQERLHAQHFGPFKQLAERLGHRYSSYFVSQKILTDAKVLRMEDSSLVSDILIAQIVGIRSKKQIPQYYRQFENGFEYIVAEVEHRFDVVMNYIGDLFGNNLKFSEFRRIHLFYTLATAVHHVLFKLPEIDLPKCDAPDPLSRRTRTMLERFDEIFAADEDSQLSREDQQFLTDSRRATTDAAVRKRRTDHVVRSFCEM